MIGYRNAVFNPLNRTVDVYTWDDDGKRCVYSHPYTPYLYVDSSNSKEFSIFGTPVKKKTFNTSYERKEYIASNEGRKFYENVTPVQQLLLDVYWEHNEDEDFDKFPLKIYFIDIEAVSENKFSEPSDPKDPINVITVYDSLSKQFHVWGLKRYTPKEDDVEYYYCSSEEVLLNKFIDFMKKDPPDILSGWYSDNYDIPYIINRINSMLGDNVANELSPTNRHYILQVKNEKNPSKLDDIHYLEGISCIDYYKVYKKFSGGERESYKLNSIGEYELGETKVDYGDISLYQFMNENWDKFVDYNIQDVRLLVKLDEKLKYFNQIRSLAYLGCTTFEPALRTIAVVLGASIISARKKKLKLYTTVRTNPKNNPGGFVNEPKIGHHDGIVSFDANSLYPNLMITLNMSPETKIGKYINTKDGFVEIKLMNGKSYRKPNTEFLSICKEQKWALSRSGIIFTQRKKGVYPDLVDKMYKRRVKIRNEMSKLERTVAALKKQLKDTSDLELKISQLNTQQQAIKIFINSVYGAFGSKYSLIGDDDIASSITLTGQAVIKKSRDIFSDFFTHKTNINDPDIIDKHLVAGDTDSLYVSMANMGVKMFENNKVTEDGYKLVDEFQNFLNDNVKKWSEEILLSVDNRLEFKREVIADVGVFTQKKRYVVHILDKEGIPCDKWKYVGVEIVQASISNFIKKHIKDIVHNTILHKDMKMIDDMFNKTKEAFENANIIDISITKGISDLDKYAQRCDGITTCKGMPINAKAAYYYNYFLEEFKIQNIYEPIKSGDKIKIVYIKKPNFYDISVLGYKGKFPKEFLNHFEVDYEKMFSKIIQPIVERFYSTMDWKFSDPNEQFKNNLEDFFA